MIPISPTSPRKVAARKFGDELRKAMAARKVGSKRLGEALHISNSIITNYRAGNNLPRVDSAARIADALLWPRLLDIVMEERLITCGRCKRPFVYEGSGPALYCSSDCWRVAQKARVTEPAADLIFARTVATELERERPRKSELRRALADFRQKRSRMQKAPLERKILALQGAISQFCLDCSPSGYCSDADCILRPVSPLQVPNRKPGPVDVVKAAPGRWADPQQHVQHAEAMVRRWSQPGAKERASARQKELWAKRTAEEREEIARRIRKARAS